MAVKEVNEILEVGIIEPKDERQVLMVANKRDQVVTIYEAIEGERVAVTISFSELEYFYSQYAKKHEIWGVAAI